MMRYQENQEITKCYFDACILDFAERLSRLDLQNATINPGQIQRATERSIQCAFLSLFGQTEW